MKVSFIFLIFLFSVVSQANVRVIGNGGGEAEMQALSEYAAIQNILSMLANTPSNHFLDDEDKEILSSALLEVGGSWKLKFTSENVIYNYDINNHFIVLNKKIFVYSNNVKVFNTQ